MATLQLTQVYLESSQKKALQRRAKAHGTKVAEEIRRAVDSYLSGIDPAELEVLDQATKEAEKHIRAMAERLASTNQRLDALFDELIRVRGSAPE